MVPQISLIMNLLLAKLQPLISVQYSLLEMSLTLFSIFFFINHCLSNSSLVWNTRFSCSMYICRWIFFFFQSHLLNCPKGCLFYLYWDQLLSLLVTLESKLLWRSRTQETPSLHLLGDWHCRWLLSSRYTLWLSPERHLQHAEFFFLKRLDVQCQVIGSAVIGKTLRNKAFSVSNILHWQSLNFMLDWSSIKRICDNMLIMTS